MRTAMSLAVGIQMDPIESIDIDADSTFALALEAQARGHALFHYLPNHLMLREGRVRAKVSALSVKRERHAHYQLGTPELLDLASLDVILMREGPPFALVSSHSNPF